MCRHHRRCILFFYDSAKNSTSLANESTPTVVFFIKNLIVQYTYQQVHEQIAMIIPPIFTTRRYIRLFFSTDCAVLLWEKIGLRREGDCRQCIQRSTHAWVGAYRSALLYDGWSQA